MTRADLLAALLGGKQLDGAKVTIKETVRIAKFAGEGAADPTATPVEVVEITYRDGRPVSRRQWSPEP